MQAFYTVNSKDLKDDQWHFNVSLNPDHDVYRGHFPQKAVAPGVMLSQMIRNLIEDELNIQLKMKEARNIKFLSMVLPEDAKSMDINIELDQSEDYKVKAVAAIDNKACFKLSATFV